MTDEYDFFEKASNLSRDFKWKDIFSDVFKPHTREERRPAAVQRHRESHTAPAHMLQQWQKPWLFVWAGIIGLVVSITATALWNTGVTNGITAMLLILLIVPAFVVPLAVVVFFWEMDMTGKARFLRFCCLCSSEVYCLLQRQDCLIFLCLCLLARKPILRGPLPEVAAKFAVVFFALVP